MNILTVNASAWDPSQLIFSGAYALQLLLSLPVNSYVVLLIATGAGGTLTSEFFNLNLAICEILFTPASISFYTSSYSTIASGVYLFHFSFFTTGRPLFQCIICIEKHLAVVHPVVFLRYKSLRYKVACCALAWLLTVIFCISFVFGDVMFIALFVCVQNQLLLLLMLFCCFSVLKALIQPGPGDQQRLGIDATKRRAFDIILIMTVCLLLNYVALLCIVFFIKNLKRQLHFSFSVDMIILVLTGLVQPLLCLRRFGKLNCANVQ